MLYAFGLKTPALLLVIIGWTELGANGEISSEIGITEGRLDSLCGLMVKAGSACELLWFSGCKVFSTKSCWVTSTTWPEAERVATTLLAEAIVLQLVGPTLSWGDGLACVLCQLDATLTVLKAYTKTGGVELWHLRLFKILWWKIAQNKESHSH